MSQRNGEKMKRIQLNETFSGEVALVEDSSILEGTDYSSLIDGKDIIGMVEGQFFQPDGMSRNKRWYSRRLWENVLASADVRSRLANRTMYGEIGHSDGPVTDMTLRSGDVSHIIADLWIDEKGRGMGRAYILDTPKGRLLKTYLGAKSKLKVSTRGEGGYLEGETHDGFPIIDPDTYELQTVDFVLNPGFLETNAKLTTKREEFTPIQEQVNKANREGENRMDMDKYVAELKEEIAELKAEKKSLSEELKSKDEELLERKFTESAEIKKINEAYAPFKKMGVSAKSLNETLKKAQNSLQKANEKNAKLTEELKAASDKCKAYEDKCGTMEEVEEALSMSEKALNTIAEYQKLGTVEELKELMARSEAVVPKLQELTAVAEEYKQLGSVKDLKSLVEKCETTLPRLKELSVLEEYRKLGSIEDIQELSKKCESMLPKLEQLNALKEYKALGSASELKTLIEKCETSLPKLKTLKQYEALGTVEEIKQLSKQCEAMLPKLAELKEAKKLAENVKKVLPKLSKMQKIEETAEKAQNVIKQYIETVGSIKKAKALVESRKETIKKVSVKEALEVSKKFGCTVESAAKLLKKYGAEKATKLLESATEKKVEETKKEVVSESVAEPIADSKKLVEEASEMDEVKVNATKPEAKTAKDFLKKSSINGFNPEALGKRTLNIDYLNQLGEPKTEGENDAKALLNKFKGAEPEVEKAPKTEPEKDPKDAEKIAKELLK
jgi:hypothetical protein